MKTLPKIRVFIWRILHSILPVRDKLWKATLAQSPVCERCDMGPESITHALRDCPASMAVLRLADIPAYLLSSDDGNCFHWIVKASRHLNEEAFCSFCVILWQCWNARNGRVKEGKNEDPRNLLDRVLILQRELSFISTTSSPILFKNYVQHGWKFPPVGTIKINTDAAIDKKAGRGAVGVLARDDKGKVLNGIMDVFAGNCDVLQVEALAIREALKLGDATGYNCIIIESDCAEVITKFNSGAADFTFLGQFVANCKALFSRFNAISIVYVPRSCNKAAHILARHALSFGNRFTFDVDGPICIHTQVADDICNSNDVGINKSV